jgi:hypothetical protein
MSRVEVAGDICLRRPRPTHGCRAEDDDVRPAINLVSTCDTNQSAV